MNPRSCTRDQSRLLTNLEDNTFHKNSKIWYKFSDCLICCETCRPTIRLETSKAI